MARNKIYTVRDLILNLARNSSKCLDAHMMDDEIKICMMSTNDEECYLKFRIKTVDENTIYISPKAISSDNKKFTVKLPKDQYMINLYKRIEEENNNGHK